MGQPLFSRVKKKSAVKKPSELSLGCGQTLPSQSKAVCLVSGGIDSPVAAWLIIRKGCTPIFVYCDNYPFTDDTTKQRAIDTIEKLANYLSGQQAKIYVIPHGSNLTEILRNCPRRLTCILCRRMMYRVAEKVAKKEKAEAIVTGEIIGEHASQTPRNLRVENNVVKDICILRPLIGMSKVEVEHLARKIGTFEVSTRPGLCCSAPPPQPRTRAKLEEIEKAEEKLDVEKIIKRDLKAAEVLRL